MFNFIQVCPLLTNNKKLHVKKNQRDGTYGILSFEENYEKYFKF